MTDIQAKYQKLAGEYSKLRSQLPVLKKAVLDEQAKEETLRADLREKETTLRKSQQELESLTFRNQQLSARVEVLQKELELITFSGNKGKKSGKRQTGASTPDAPLSDANSVIGEELQAKIEENARLHKQVYEGEVEHQQVVGDLSERLMRLEEEASRHQQQLDSSQKKTKGEIQQLTDDRTTLQVKLQNQETESKSAKQRAQAAEEALSRIESDLSTRLNDAVSTINTKLPFNDSASKELESLNIPCHNRRQQLQTKELLSQAAALVKQLTQGLSNLYTYSEQRAAMYPTDSQTEMLSDVNKRLCGVLHENAGYLRRVEQTFRSLADNIGDDSLTTLETAIGLQEFAIAWKKFVLYATKMLPYQILSLEEECALSSCTEMLELKNVALRSGLQTFTAALTKLDTYISILATYSSSQCDIPQMSQGALFKLLADALTHFHEVTKDLSKQFNAKITLEHQLPTATQKLMITDECIVSALISLVTCTSKLSAFLAGNLEFISQHNGPAVRRHPVVADLRQRAACYLTSLSRPCPESVPYEAAVENRQTLLSTTESRESLAGQVLGLQERLRQLEADKEHWMLEAQLQQVKYDKQTKCVTDMQTKVKQLQNQLTGSIEDNVENHIVQPPTKTSIDAEMGGLSEAAAAREQLIKEHFSQRIGQLSAQLQHADSNALHFNAECRALHKRLALAHKQRDTCQEHLTSANQTIAQLKDELATTTRSYEGQLSMMSEHLAGMNEKLTSQTDQIDALKFQLNHKGDKKNKRR